MNCFRCGAELKMSSSQLCEKCSADWEHEKRQQQALIANVMPATSDYSGGRSIPPENLLGIAFLIGVAAFIGFQIFYKPMAAVTEIDGLLKVQQEQSDVFYSIGDNSTYKGHLILWQRDKNLGHDMGIAVAVGYLSPSNYDTYRNNYGHGKGCPASFLNANNQMLMLISDDPELAEFTANNSYEEGAEVDIMGQQLTMDHIEVDGEIIPGNMNMGGALLLRPLSIAINGSPVYIRK